MLDNRQVQIDLRQKRGNQPWRPNKIQDRSKTGMNSLSETEECGDVALAPGSPDFRPCTASSKRAATPKHKRSSDRRF